ETSYSPMATELESVLRSWLSSSKDKRRIAQICQIADRSAAMVFSSPDALRSFLSKFALTSDLLEAACLQLFGFQPTGPQPPPGQPYPSQGGYGYPLQARSADGGITARELEHALASQRREFESLLTSALERRSDQESRDREVAERVAEARNLGRLESELGRLADKIESLKDGNKQQAADPVILERLSGLQSKFDDLRREAEARERIEMELSPLREELVSLREKLTPSRTPAEYEVKSANLQAVVERAGASMDQLTALLAKIGVPSMMGQLSNQLLQMGIPSEEIPQIISAMMSSQTPAMPMKHAKTSGLSSKIDQARARWIRQSPPPAAQVPQPASQATEPESKWPGEMRYVEQPRERVP
ncbi:hypothetical protein M1O56_05985, partial [Dehalococcoidia bacterium]|nr:hypothetical protein [Dehalococcoidia bacterium]